MGAIAPYAKAVTAAIVTGLGVLAGYLVNDTALGDITAGQWVAVVVAFLIGLAAVWAVPNKPAA
jgi:hypothetical protein